MQQGVDGAVTPFAWDWALPDTVGRVPELLTDGLAVGALPTARYLVGHDTLGWESAAGWTYPVPDALGSVRQAVDGSGAVIGAREWTPYGVEVGDAQAGLGYTGEWWDAAVGLQYLRARWYDARTGAFLTRDAVEENHPYLYVKGNPVNYTDPTGHDVGCPGGDVSGCLPSSVRANACMVQSCSCSRPSAQRGDIILLNRGNIIPGEWDHAVLVVEVNPVEPEKLWAVEAERDKGVWHHSLLLDRDVNDDESVRDWVVLRVNRPLSTRNAVAQWAENLAGWEPSTIDDQRRETSGAPFVSMIPFRDSPWGWFDIGAGKEGYYCFEVVVDAYRTQGVELIDIRRAYQDLIDQHSSHSSGEDLQALALANLGPELGAHIYGSAETFVVDRKAWRSW